MNENLYFYPLFNEKKISILISLVIDNDHSTQLILSKFGDVIKESNRFNISNILN